jgi:CHAT domain-containing protein
MKTLLSKISLLMASLTCLPFLNVKSTTAQSIVPASDGTATLTNPDGNRIDISGGSLSGDGHNLFHSFEKFGIDVNQTANFLSNPNIQNILSRVVGGDVSLINGLLQVTGSNANFFFINPAGIIFGPNASLNLLGDFTATTATGIGFSGGWFNAFGTNDYITLVGDPNAFQFGGDRAGFIINQGDLQLAAGNDLTFLSGTIISLGTIQTPRGKVTLTTVPGTSKINLSQEGQILSLEVDLPKDSLGNILPIKAVDLPGLLTGGNNVDVGDIQVNNISADRASITANNNLNLVESKITTTGDLQLLAQNELIVRDSLNKPIVLEAGENLTLQGNKAIDIFALNHPQSGLFSGKDLNLLSNYTIGGDAHFWSGGNFTIASLNGQLNNLESFYDPVIRANLDVRLGDYTGASLHVLAGGTVTIGNVTITGVDATNAIAETVTLSDGTSLSINGTLQPTLDVRAGIDWSLLGGFPGNTIEGIVSPSPGFLSSATSANIDIGTIDINSPNGLVFLTNRYNPNSALSGTITTNTINTTPTVSGNSGRVVIDSQTDIRIDLDSLSGGGSILTDNTDNNAGDVLLNANDNILVNDITTSNINAAGGNVRLQAGGDIEVNSSFSVNFTGIDTRGTTGGNIDITSNNGSISIGQILTGASGQAGNVNINAFNSLAIVGDVDITSTGGNALEGTISLIGDIIIVDSNVFRGGDIILTGDEIELPATLPGAITGTDNNLTLQPRNPSQNIAINGINDTGDLDISDVDLPAIANGFNSITIGRTDSNGTITITNPTTFFDPITLRTPLGSIVVNGTILGNDNASVDIIGSGNTTILNADIITAGNPITIDDNVILSKNPVNLDTTAQSQPGANITILGTIDGNTSISGNEGLNLTAGIGNINITGAIGAIERLGSLNANSEAISRFNATINATTVTTDALGTTELNGNVDTLGEQNYSDRVSIEIPLSLTSGGGPISFATTLQSQVGENNTLTINADAGNVTFSGDIGNINALDDLTINSSGITRFNATVTVGSVTTNAGGITQLNDRLTTTRAQVYNDPIIIDSTVTLDSSSGGIAFNDILNSQTGESNHLTINVNGGNLTFNNTVGATTNLGNIIANSTGVTRFNTTVSANSLTTDAGGSTQLNGNVTTLNPQTYNDAVRIDSSLTLNSSNGGLSFNNSLNSETSENNNLTINTNTGNITFNNTIGVIDRLGDLIVNSSGITRFDSTINVNSLTTDAGGSTQLNTDITTVGSQTYNDAVRVDNPISLTSNSGAIVFNNTIDSGFGQNNNFTLNTNTGNITFNGVVGGTIPLGTLTLNSNGITRFNSTVNTINLSTNTGGTTQINGNITTTNSQTYNDAVSLDNSVTLNSTNGGINFVNTLNSETGENNNLTINANTGNINFNNTVGSTNSLGDLTANSTGVTRFNATVSVNNLITNVGGSTQLNGNVSATTSQTYNDAVRLDASLSFNGGVNFNSTLDSQPGETNNLTIDNNANNISFNGVVGGSNRLGNLTLNSSGITRLNQIINATNLTTNAGGSTQINANINTSNGQTYNDPVRIDSAVNLISNGSIDFIGTVTSEAGENNHLTINTNSGNLTFNSAIDSLGDLTANSSGTTRFNSTVSVNSLTTDAGGNTQLNGNVITTSQQIYNDPVRIDTPIAITSDNGGVSFNSSLDSETGENNSLTANSNTGNLTFNGAIGTNSGLGNLNANSTVITRFNSTVNANSLTTNGGGSTQLNSNVTTTNSQTYNDSIRIDSSVTLNSNNNGINFNNVVDSETGESNNLTVNANNNNLTFNSTVGNTNSLAALTVNSSGTTRFNSSVSANSLTTDAGGSTQINGNVTTTNSQTYNDGVRIDNSLSINSDNGGVSFNNRVDGETGENNNLTVNANGGLIVFNDGVNSLGNVNANTTDITRFNSTVNVNSLTTDAGGSTQLNDNVTTTNAQNYNDPVVLNNSLSLNSSNAGISFNNTINSETGEANNLTINTNANDLNFNGRVGSIATLGNITVNSSGVTRFNSTVNANSITTDGVGSTQLNGDITTTNTQTYNDAARIDNSVTLNSGGIVFNNTVIGESGEINNLTVNTNTENITFNNSVSGLGDITVNSSGVTRFNSTINANSVTVNGNGSTQLNGNVTTTNSQTYNDAVSIDNDITLNGTSVTFNNTLTSQSDENNSLNISTTDNVSLNGNVNLGDLNIISDRVNISAGAIATTGDQTYNSPVELSANTSITGNDITFNSTIDSILPRSLNINNFDLLEDSGDTTINGIVGGNERPLENLTITTQTGNIILQGETISTTENQTYNGDILVTGNLTLNADVDNTGMGAIETNSIATLNNDLAINAPNIVTGDIDTSNDFTGNSGDLQINATQGTIITGNISTATNGIAGNVNLSGSGDITVGNIDTLALSNFNGGDVTISSTQGNLITGNIEATSLQTGGAIALSALKINPGNITTSNSNITLNGAVTIALDKNITSNNGNIAFFQTIDGTGNLILDAGNGTIGFGGAIGSITSLNGLTVNNAANVQIGNNITTNNSNLTFNSPVTFTGNSIINVGNGIISFNRNTNVGSNNLSLLTDAGVNFSATESFIATGGTLILQPNDPTRPIAIESFDSNSFSLTNLQAINGFNNIIIGRDNSSGTITINNPVTFFDSVTLRAPQGSILVNGTLTGEDNASINIIGSGNTTILAADIITAGTPITINDSVILANNSIALNTTARSQPGANITINGTIDGDSERSGLESLTFIVGVGNIDVVGAIGNIERLGNLIVNSTGTSNFNNTIATTNIITDTGGNTQLNGNVDTRGTISQQNYQDAVIVASDISLTNTSDTLSAGISFGNTVDSVIGEINNLTVTDNTGNISFQGQVGNNNSLRDLTVNTNLTTSFNATVIANSLTTNAFGTTQLNANITTTDRQSYGDAVRIDSSLVLNSIGGLNFNNTVNSQVEESNNLTVNANGNNVTFNDAVGNINSLGNLTVSSGATTSFNSTVTANSVTTDSGGVTQLNGNVTTNFSQNYGDATIINNSIILTSNNGGVNFGNILDSGFSGDLTVNANTGNIIFNDRVGSNNPLGNIIVNSSGITRFNSTANANSLVTNNSGTTQLNGNINTTNNQNYGDPVRLDSSIALTSGSNGILFNNTLISEIGENNNLTIDANGGNITFNGIVTNLGALNANSSSITRFNSTISAQSLTTNAGGTTLINGNVTTINNQNYGDAVIIDNSSTLTASTIAFNNTIDSQSGENNNLAIASSGNVSLNGSIGANNALATLTISGTNTNINTPSIRTSGDQIYNTSVELQTDTTLTGNNLTFNNTIRSTTSRSLSIVNNGNITFNNNIGDNSRPLSNLVVAGTTGQINFNASSVITENNQVYNANLVLNNNIVFNSNNGNYTAGAISTLGTDLNIQAINILTGNINAVNGSQGGAITLSGNNITVGNLFTTNNSITLNGSFNLPNDLNVTANNGNITFSQNIDGAGNLILDAGNGTIQLSGAIGTNVPLGGLVVNNASDVRIGNNITTNNSNLTFNSQVTLIGNATFNVGNATISFNNNTNVGNNNISLIAERGINFPPNGTFTGAGGELLLQPTNPASNIVIEAIAPNSLSLTNLQAINGFNRIAIGRDNSSGNITIANPVTFNDPVTLRAPFGTITVNANIIGENDASIDIIGSGNTTTLNADIITAGTPINIDDSVILSKNPVNLNTTARSQPGANINITGTVNGSNGFNLTAGIGDINLNGFIGNLESVGDITANSSGVTNLPGITANSLTTDVGGTTQLNEDVSTIGSQTYNDAIAIFNDPNLTSQNSAISFNNTVDSAENNSLTINSGNGDINFANNVGNNSPLGDIILNSSGNTVLNGTVTANSLITDAGGTTQINNNVTTTNDQTYQDPVLANNNLSINARNLTFGHTLNGTSEFVIISSLGTVSFNNLVGANISLQKLTIDGASRIDIANNITIDNGDLGLNSPIFLNGNSTFDVGAGRIILGDALNAQNNSLTLISDTQINLANNGVVGNGGELLIQTKTTNRGIAIGTLDSNSLSIFNLDRVNGFNRIAIGSNSNSGTIAIGSNGVTFQDPVLLNSPQGEIRILGTVRGEDNASIDIIGSGNTTYISADIITAGTPINIDDNVIIANTNINLNTTARSQAGANIIIDGTISGDSTLAGLENLTLTAGTGNINITGAISFIGNLIANSQAIATFNNTINTTTFTTDAGGTTQLNGGSVITSSNQTYNDNLNLGTNSEFIANNGNYTAKDIAAANFNINIAATNITTGNINTNFNDGTGGNITLNASQGDIVTGNLDASANNNGGSISLTSATNITTGNINTSSSQDNAGNIVLQAQETINTQDILAFAQQNLGGNVTLNTNGNIQVNLINTQGFSGGGTIDITTDSFFKAIASFGDRNNIEASISSTAIINSGDITIRHGGRGRIPFDVNNSISNNRTLAAITSDRNVTIANNSYLFTFRRGNIAIISVDGPNPNDNDPLDAQPPIIPALNALPLQPEVQVLTTQKTQEILSTIEKETGIKPAVIYVSFTPTTITTLDNEANFTQREKDLSQGYKDIFDATPDADRAKIAIVPSNSDELELVLVTADKAGIRVKVPGITYDRVKEQAQKLYSEVSELGDNYKDPATKLYEWLLTPIQKTLQQEKIDNLLYIMPEGLRLLPLAALYDGKEYLIQQYSIGFAPSISLTDTRYRSIKNLPVLALGASKFASSEDQSELPAVNIEVPLVTKEVGKGKYLLNEQFTLNNLKNSREDNPYPLVHLSTHGDFQPGEISESYIQLYDRKLKLTELRELGLDNPTVEMLVISACRSAFGDREAELGFGGLAAQIGVKTVVASLWYVGDTGTLALMSEFYRNIKESPIKAQALREAQIEMIMGKVKKQNGKIINSQGEIDLPEDSSFTEENLSHPFYWGAFTTIGSPW